MYRTYGLQTISTCTVFLTTSLELSHWDSAAAHQILCTCQNKDANCSIPSWWSVAMGVVCQFSAWWFWVMIWLNSLRPSDAYMRQWSNQHWFRQWLVAWSAPSHYQNQCWNIVNKTLRNKLQWNLHQNSYIFIQENAFENVVWKTAAILSRPQCVNTLLTVLGLTYAWTNYSRILKRYNPELTMMVSKGASRLR